FGYTRFAATQSFNAVFGQSGGMMFGGGGEVRLGHVFINASVDRFQKTGNRVFVSDDGTVFQLGTSDTVTLTPIVATAGWRFDHEHVTPYIGGGVGRVFYKRTAVFDDDSESLNSRFTDYHLLGGIEVRNGWVATAFEVQYSRVPNAAGMTGASASFHEA